MTMKYDEALTSRVKESALECGFARVGVAPVGAVEHADAFRAWLAAGYHADMTYLEENVEKRLNPAQLIEGAKSVICLAVSYAPDGDEPSTDAFIARYARGGDYHKVLKKRAQTLCDRIRTVEPSFEGRAFVDTAPVAERTLAAAAGLGWIGRNGSLIVPGLGSYILLAEIVCNLPLRPDEPRPNGCGDCEKCLAACPTGAIVAGKTIDARRCLSYQTIENRGEIPPGLWPLLGQCVFGCDACQAICPHNRRRVRGDAELTHPPDSEPLSLQDILTWTESDWDRATRGKAFRRADHRMFLRNAILAAGNAGDASHLPLLEALPKEETLQPYIDWARKQISGSCEQ
ncbi:MAG: tRNA epoxyqueuosine(34) reductase QueG [Phycisphaerae bacterium]|nr:tRNA epoxyqueuosine(34) reductase QueG [Phycisphaerae bacterium]